MWLKHDPFRVTQLNIILYVFAAAIPLIYIVYMILNIVHSAVIGCALL